MLSPIKTYLHQLSTNTSSIVLPTPYALGTDDRYTFQGVICTLTGVGACVG
ncbi:hypothetical protein J008_05551 [Cryptococcus neoformans]|nr:hypothetical protein C362_05819 [Cryptococcus neoformans var. grubii Bt1]OXH24923.1 hypothetical protein J008_05551 [Cryptococcus neoformans var. grubii]